ncbi:MAG: hypothetical protein U0792_02540 [Gemmataceae bacterium]
MVYVASDGYNDEVPTQFLHMLVKAGKSVVVAHEGAETDAAALVEHFKREILAGFRSCPTAARRPCP